ncbi:Metallophosphoesterase domain-containing protein 1 [Colletotrichum chlorophyti]|uniref:Metallophosphoesterase domain-containing protein 1 n=1 Tax=Colletotrichum chlorophyti TaxID=708187 RepID=A0A1Q8RZD8_9PEZI|nr:Metallophosphoesterase domain-containing protein 1 [Colletotrichum chlorophyti]
MDASRPDVRIKTRFLIISDTHGAESLPGNSAAPVQADVVIHCGDLTQHSRLAEFRSTVNLMRTIDAPLKLLVAGNHDFTLDVPVFRNKVAEMPQPVDMDLVRGEFGDFGEARQALLESCAENGIVFLDEGTRTFTLANGASLTVFASPYSYAPQPNDWGFEGGPGKEHEWAEATWPWTSSSPTALRMAPWTAQPRRIRCGSAVGGLFAAVARAKPRMHCFGHVHQGWGAKLVRWRRGLVDYEAVQHFSAVDIDGSFVVETLASLVAGPFDAPDVVDAKMEKLQASMARGYVATSHCADDDHPLHAGENTLFVNAAVGRHEQQPPWIIDIELARASS